MKLILITNNSGMATLAESAGVDRIMVDLEVIGKRERQGHLNTVISKHTLNDVAKIHSVLKSAKLMVRVNPVHPGSKNEIDTAIDFGADILMLPMFHNAEQASFFLKLVDKRASTSLLLETSQALIRLADILALSGIDELYVGLNDLHLSLGLDFMFELVAYDTLESIAQKVSRKNIIFGFGGIARLGEGALDPGLILSEHVRIGSEMVILSRTFHGDSKSQKEMEEKVNFKTEIQRIREKLDELAGLSRRELLQNKQRLIETVKKIVKE